MGLFHYLWSRTAASNATADSNVNWAEGMAPSAVNDSARSMMASLAGYRDDIAGAITTGGTSTAYTVTTYQVFDTLAHLSGQIVAFTPHATNGATVTLNVDGLGAKPLRSAPSVELPAGVLIEGTPYVALYNNSDQAFYLQSFFSNPYSIPIGASIDYWGSTAPNSSFVLAYGQAISRTTYSTLFSMFSTTYGSGDGSTTFNVPDLRGRVIAGRGDMGGSDAGRLTTTYLGANPAALGSAGGGETKTLATANLPAYTPSGSVGPQLSFTYSAGSNYDVSGSSFGVSTIAASGLSSTVTLSAQSFTGVAQGGTSTPFALLQPTIIANKLLRII
ncbi:Microcystin-dependent protein [Bradyrhizobium yuanmingense]|uniref:Microcystin-dependent protein n=1 Tax=Bradyrhizobium yuanmingense TaxID=108015 RepID=A0A1C3XKB6_9BRAD|nr:tail fiber protein [Bradyrhizobium yuanmingense]TWI18998.1 microcystin-dependent protein [Bradyrhizobium yuanmingense]SCB52731.1 Microcystin-dependent protein [Bradyrhizobium yuanmingense]